VKYANREKIFFAFGFFTMKFRYAAMLKMVLQPDFLVFPAVQFAVSSVSEFDLNMATNRALYLELSFDYIVD
jgi:hypothetical protein